MSQQVNTHTNTGAAVAEGFRAVVLQPEGRRFDPQSDPSICRSFRWQGAEPRMAAHRIKKVLRIDALYEIVSDWVNVKVYCKAL